MRKFWYLVCFIIIVACSSEEDSSDGGANANNNPPLAPVIISPGFNGTVVLNSPNDNINFSWEPSFDPDDDVERYRIEISEDPNFNNAFSDVVFSESYQYQHSNVNVSLYWRVKAFDQNQNESPYSSGNSQFFLQDGFSPEAPLLIYPLDGENCQSANLTIDWDDSIDPNGLPITYELVISESPVFTPAAQTFTTSSSEYTLNLNAGQAYYWNVTASNGTYTTTSATYSFYAQGSGSGNTVPFLTQRAPHSGFVTDDTFINLEAQVGDAETSLNDLVVEIYFGTDPNNLNVVATDDGSFSNVQVQLPNIDIYYWKVHVSDTDGATFVSQIWNIERE